MDASAAKDAELTSLTTTAEQPKSSLATLSASYEAVSDFQSKFAEAEKMCQEFQIKAKVTFLSFTSLNELHAISFLYWVVLSCFS